MKSRYLPHEEAEFQSLPQRMHVDLCHIKESPFLKHHLMQNGCHDSDRERASSLVKNMVVPKDKKDIPFLSKKKKKEKSVNLQIKDLIKLQQVASDKVPAISFDYMYASQKIAQEKDQVADLRDMKDFIKVKMGKQVLSHFSRSQEKMSQNEYYLNHPEEMEDDAFSRHQNLKSNAKDRKFKESILVSPTMSLKQSYPSIGIQDLGEQLLRKNSRVPNRIFLKSEIGDDSSEFDIPTSGKKRKKKKPKEPEYISQMRRRQIPLKEFKRAFQYKSLNSKEKLIQFAASDKQMVDVLEKEKALQTRKTLRRKQTQQSNMSEEEQRRYNMAQFLDKSLCIQEQNPQIMEEMQKKYFMKRTDITSFIDTSKPESNQRGAITQSKLRLTEAELFDAGVLDPDDQTDMMAGVYMFPESEAILKKAANSEEAKELELKKLMREGQGSEKELHNIRGFIKGSQESLKKLKKAMARWPDSPTRTRRPNRITVNEINGQDLPPSAFKAQVNSCKNQARYPNESTEGKLPRIKLDQLDFTPLPKMMQCSSITELQPSKKPSLITNISIQPLKARPFRSNSQYADFEGQGSVQNFDSISLGKQNPSPIKQRSPHQQQSQTSLMRIQSKVRVERQQLKDHKRDLTRCQNLVNTQESLVRMVDDILIQSQVDKDDMRNRQLQNYYELKREEEELLKPPIADKGSRDISALSSLSLGSQGKSPPIQGSSANFGIGSSLLELMKHSQAKQQSKKSVEQKRKQVLMKQISQRLSNMHSRASRSIGASRSKYSSFVSQNSGGSKKNFLEELERLNHNQNQIGSTKELSDSYEKAIDRQSKAWYYNFFAEVSPRSQRNLEKAIGRFSRPRKDPQYNMY